MPPTHLAAHMMPGFFPASPHKGARQLILLGVVTLVGCKPDPVSGPSDNPSVADPATDPSEALPDGVNDTGIPDSGAGIPDSGSGIPDSGASDSQWCTEANPFSWEITDVAEDAGVLHADGRGRGAATADFNGDGLIDLVTANLGDHTQVYINQGDGTFTPQPGTPGVTWTTAAAAPDYDSDGDPDLFFSCGGFTTDCNAGLFRNDGPDKTGVVVFTDVTEQAGLGNKRVASFGSAWSDVDLDGDLDLYLSVKDLTRSWATPEQCGPTHSGGEWGPQGPPPLPDLEASTADVFYLNQGDGTFTDATEIWHLGSQSDSHQAAFADLDNDGDPDLVVPVLGGHNEIYRNDGTFFTLITTYRLALPDQAFAVLLDDFDNNGWIDIFFVADFDSYYGEWESHKLFLNRGDWAFEEVAVEAGLSDPDNPEDQPVMGFQTGDLDQDGWSEVFFGNGNPEPWGAVENRLYSLVSSKDSLVAIDRSALIDFGSEGLDYPSRSHGTIIWDFDQDGRSEMFVNNGGIYHDQREPNRLFRITSECINRYIQVALSGSTANLGGVGARLRLADAAGDDATWEVWHHVAGSSGFNSWVAPVTRLGAGIAEGPYHLTVVWPGGEESYVEGLMAGDEVQVVQDP